MKLSSLLLIFLIASFFSCEPKISQNDPATQEAPFLKRIGLFPLRVMAQQVFGRHHCDLILPREAVKKLLCSDNNRNVLKEGRILIIINTEEERGVGNEKQE